MILWEGFLSEEIMKVYLKSGSVVDVTDEEGQALISIHRCMNGRQRTNGKHSFNRDNEAMFMISSIEAVY